MTVIWWRESTEVQLSIVKKRCKYDSGLVAFGLVAGVH